MKSIITIIIIMIIIIIIIVIIIIIIIIIRDERKVDTNQYVNDFSKLPLSLVYGFEEPEDEISILNKLFSDCLESHDPTSRVKLTRPIAPWMKDPIVIVKN